VTVLSDILANKKALVYLLFITIIIISLIFFILIHQKTNNETKKLDIKSFSTGNSWENPGGLEVTLPFNLTIQNSGTSDLQGLKVMVEMFESGSSVRVETFFGEDEPFNGTLCAGEALEIKGLIGTTVNSTSVMFPIGGTSETFTYLAKVTLNDTVLDECWAGAR
jgi:hypothetical protein